MKTRAITEGAIMAAISVITALLSYYVPFLSLFSYLLLPLPTIILYKRYGFGPALTESIAASLLLLLFMGPLNALLLGVDIILPGLLLGYGYHEDKSGGYRVLLGFFAYLGTFALEMVLFERMTGVTIMDDFVNSINATTDFMSGIYQEAGLYTGDEGQALQDSIAQLSESVKMLFPAMIIIIPAIISWLIVKIDDIIFRRLKLSYKPVAPMTEWRIPLTARNVLALVVIVSAISGRLITNPILEVYPYTFEAIASFIFLIMGFAFIFWLIKLRFRTNFMFLRICIVICCLVFPILVTAIILIGMVDVYFNIRRFFQNREIE